MMDEVVYATRNSTWETKQDKTGSAVQCSGDSAQRGLSFWKPKGAGAALPLTLHSAFSNPAPVFQGGVADSRLMRSNARK